MESSRGKYFLMKNGLYYRPGNLGYTKDLLQAGVFEEDEVTIYKNSVSGEVLVLPIEHRRDEFISLFKMVQENAKVIAEAFGLPPDLNKGHPPSWTMKPSPRGRSDMWEGKL